MRERESNNSQYFSTIYIDPPWPERGGGKIKRGADRHYKLLRVGDIYSVIRMSGVWKPANDAHLYLWATNTYLPAGLWLMNSLGFRYVTALPWIKLTNEAFALREVMFDYSDKRGRIFWLQLFTNLLGRAEITLAEIIRGHLKFGIGQYFRGVSEILLFGVCGRGFEARTDRRDLPGAIIGPRSKHSSKPLEAYKLIEARSKGPRLEMFSRSDRVGWVHWGEEAGRSST